MIERCQASEVEGMGVQLSDDCTRIVTVPDEITEDRFVTVTGNDFVSLPEIDAWGRIAGVTFLHAGCAGLIEVRGGRHGTGGAGAASRATAGGDQADNRDAPPFVAPVFVWNGAAVDLAGAVPEFALEEDWIPTFSWTGGNGPGSGGVEWRLSARIVAPPDEKGFCYILELQRLGLERHEGGEAAEDGCAEHNPEAAGTIRAELGVHLAWGYSGIRVFTSRELPLVRTCRYDRWTHGVVAEALGPVPVFGFALNASGDFDRLEVAGSAGDVAASAGGWDCAAPAGGAIPAPGSPDGVGTSGVVVRATKFVTLTSGERATVAFYVAFNREADGARTTGVHLRRLGWQALEAETRRWLTDRRIPVPGQPREEAVLNRNLLFCRFFATGRALDSEEVVAVTSRSPRYYVSAAFWARDVLLWSLPGLMLVDRARGREVLLRAFSVGTRHVGDHAEYIDGRGLYPGFELDEAAAFLVGLGTYLDATSDFDIIREPQVLEGVRRVLAEIERWTVRTADGKPVLCRTFLDPSDDPVRLPFLTYNNVLVRKGWLVAADVLERIAADGDDDQACHVLRQQARELREAAETLGEAIRRYCVVDGPFGPMYAWAVGVTPHEPSGVEGEPGAIQAVEVSASYRGSRRAGAELYDDPPGSLELLGHYGYCRDGDGASILANTRRWIRSLHNPYFVEGRFAAPGSAHSPHPWPMAVASSVLAEAAAQDATGRCDLGIVRSAVELLTAAPMDSGLACESIDAETGMVKTGAAFASAAGFLGYSLWRGLGLLGLRAARKACGTGPR
ncbi:MAG: glycoside hydrolase family 125 protein [Bacillota bacterium]|nr:glycoside hydrolase family 125 protein [Bacillota bacterium]